MVSKDSDRFKFNKNGTDFLTDSYIGYSSGSNDLNILDSKIELNQVEHFLKKEDMYARHEIIKNIYSSLIKLTKPCVLIGLIFVTVIVYPLSKIELPFDFGRLLMNYLKVFYELITACTSFLLGAVISNWISSKIDR